MGDRLRAKRVIGIERNTQMAAHLVPPDGVQVVLPSGVRDPALIVRDPNHGARLRGALQALHQAVLARGDNAAL